MAQQNQNMPSINEEIEMDLVDHHRTPVALLYNHAQRKELLMTTSQNQHPILPHPNTPSRSQRLAQATADFVMSGLIIVFWLVVGVAGLGAAYIAVTAVIWVIKLARAALGV